FDETILINLNRLSNMKWKQLLLVVLVGAASGIGGVWVYSKLSPRQAATMQQIQEGKLPVNYAGFLDNLSDRADPIDFTKAASAAVPAVVHIKTKIPARRVVNELPGNRGGNS